MIEIDSEHRILSSTHFMLMELISKLEKKGILDHNDMKDFVEITKQWQNV